MGDQVHAPIAAQTHSPEVRRPLANFQPDIWGNLFLSYTPLSELTSRDSKYGTVPELKEQVQAMLEANASNPSRQLQFIDAIQRLGVAYHFEEEIGRALRCMHDKYRDWEENNEILIAALYFRILRQEGFNISCDIFQKFMNVEGNFLESLSFDVPGMLALYEAAHLRVHGEHILDNALAFTRTRLQSIACNLSKSLSERVSRTLKQSYWRGIPRLEARHFISVYEEDPSRDKSLLMLAKLDFNILQSLHREELSEICRWWKEADFARKLPFVRDRIVEGYFWILGVYFEPQYSLARKIMTKVIALTSIQDDIYDAYGTHQELQILTEAIERWSSSCLDQLPEYMKFFYQQLLDLYDEIEDEMAKQGRSYRTYYAKEAIKVLARAYMTEAKWLNEGYTPTVEEYMPVGIASCGFTSLAITSFLGMGEIAAEEGFDWALNDLPEIIKAASIICRLTDDIVGHEFEQKRGHVASAVECYMKQHGVTEQQACNELYKLVEEAWKSVNKELLKPPPVPVPLLVRVLNLARVIDTVYKDNDEYTHVGEVMRRYIPSVLIEPIPV